MSSVATQGSRGFSMGRLLLLLMLGAMALIAHLADGYAWCQEYWNWDGRRCSKDGRRWPAEDGKVITYINGIFHSVPEWEGITHQLQAIFGHEVRAFYNPSSGWWITDASKAGYALLRRPTNDTVAKALGEHLAQAVDDVGKGRVLHIAHSGGALITYLAAQHHLSKRQRDKIDVLTFGGARSITRKYFSGRVVNYYARNDPLVKLDRRAADLMRLTNDTNFQEVYEKHNTTFVFLEGRAGHFVQDHSLEGPTYQHALRKEARSFRRAHFGPLSPLAWDYETSLLRLARKKVAEISGVHYFFSAEQFGLRSARKALARLTGFHGFFSGKLPDSGVQVIVVGDETGAGPLQPAADASGVSNLVRRLLPWGKKSSENIADLLSKDTVSPREQFWLGFRWGRRDTRAEESNSGDLAMPLTIAEIEDEKSPWSRWVDLRRVVGLGRGQAEADTASEEAGIDETIDPEAEEDESSLQKAGINGKLSILRVSRPWLSTGWIPWGSSRNALQDSSATIIPGAEDSAAERSGTEAREGENEGLVGDAEQTAVPSAEELLEGRSYQWGWWYSSTSSNSSSSIGQDIETSGEDNVTTESSHEERGESLKEGDGANDARSFGDSESAAMASPKEDASILRRWLPVTMGYGKANVNVACAEESDLREGNGATRAGQVERTEVAVEPSPSTTSPEPSNVWRLWAALKGTRAHLSRPSDDVAAAAEEVSMDAVAEAGTMGNSSCSSRSSSAEVDELAGEVIMIESETRQKGGTEQSSRKLDQLKSIEAERPSEGDGGEAKESFRGDSWEVGDQSHYGSGSDRDGVLGAGRDAFEARDGSGESAVPGAGGTVNTSNITISNSGSVGVAEGEAVEQGVHDLGEKQTLLYRDTEGVNGGTDSGEPPNELEKDKRETTDRI